MTVCFICGGVKSELGPFLLRCRHNLLHEICELWWKFFVHPSIDEGTRLTINRLFEPCVVFGCVEKLLAVDQSAVVSGQKFREGWNLG